MKYILIFIYSSAPREYYGGGSYIFRGEKYAVLARSKDEAKRFKSRRIAENAYKKLFESCVNVEARYEIVEVPE